MPRPGTFNAITVDMDSDWQTVVSLTGSFQKDNSFIGCWGKIPDVTKFRDGTLISKLEDDETRTFSRVTELIPGESIRISRALFPAYYRDYLYTDVAILEDEFMDWEIED